MLSPQYVLGLVVVPVLVPAAVWAVFKTIKAIRGGREVRRSMRQVIRLKWGWVRLARMLDLYVQDASPRLPRVKTLVGRKEGPAVIAKARSVFPPMHLKADQYGVVAKVRTIPKVGLAEWQERAQHLADAWGCVRVSITQNEAGRLVVRAVRRDPLTIPATHHPTSEAAANLASVPIGLDEYADPVSLRFAGVPGIAILGLPGYGKTSLISKLIADLAPCPDVQMAFLDGKGEGTRVGADYEDLATRAWFASGDDLQAANDFLHQVEQLRTQRAGSIREILGCKNVWTAAEANDGSRRPGFTRDWPLVLVVMDEVHTYFQTVKDGGDPDLKQRNALATQNVLLVENLVKKARAVGIVLVLATQKGTGDAIPTQIRDVCPVSLSFACKTSEAAVAALGAEIREYPDANPISLQDPAYIGVASMVVEGRRGFTRVRTPFTDEQDAANACTDNHELTADPLRLLPRRGLAVVVDDHQAS